jgi:molybdenum cofactor cytidylyltransferase
MPPPVFPTLGAILLGAGASSRMGAPKLLLPWRDTTVVGHLLSQWQGLGAGQITIVHRPADAPLFAELKRLDFGAEHWIENPRPEEGMFGSILCAARWPGWNKDISRWAIILGDQPHLRPETLRALLEFSAQNPAKICQPTCSGRQGHPVILPGGIFGELKSSRDRTLKDFLKPFAGGTVYCPVTDTGLLLDMDTPEDYKRVQSR